MVFAIRLLTFDRFERSFPLLSDEKGRTRGPKRTNGADSWVMWVMLVMLAR